ncbi:Hypothetical_protein [Hexamita inflata]|uniref:Hypothetical_protein n=1 Tax=Hexamita inflata TaxID=28002 RepID=A0ABP1HYB0_9EUKA
MKVNMNLSISTKTPDTKVPFSNQRPKSAPIQKYGNEQPQNSVNKINQYQVAFQNTQFESNSVQRKFLQKELYQENLRRVNTSEVFAVKPEQQDEPLFKPKAVPIQNNIPRSISRQNKEDQWVQSLFRVEQLYEYGSQIRKYSTRQNVTQFQNSIVQTVNRTPLTAYSEGFKKQCLTKTNDIEYNKQLLHVQKQCTKKSYCLQIKLSEALKKTKYVL